ncbi:MAG: EAL domain-containing protein, partial [Acholeplasmatales bacterium]|nr:EAL domain-containing protein [Acholeplasmatales bacterium]
KLDLAYRNMGELSSKDYVVYEAAMDNIILATDEMERDIETGLIDKEFQMWLQPQFDIVNNRVDGFEALIRWMNPKYRDKSPQIFIELAEKRGHMLDIGRFVITESFKLAKKLEPYNIHISVNVSPVQLLQVGFVQQLIDEFNKNQLKVGSIAIEITETLLMGSFKLVAEKLRLLKEAGFHIHLDDFCTGYSSMLYLKDLPVDTLKIDKEFTKYIVTNKFNENIVKTICNLAKDLDLSLVCEGVESQEQADMVKKFGCRIIQGYLYGKAMPYDQAVEMLEQYNSKKR